MIWLPFCKNRKDGPEPMICEGKAPRTVWLTHSGDDGATWRRRWEITPPSSAGLVLVRDRPGARIQLAGGRLLVRATTSC